jgi:hypothetical protein
MATELANYLQFKIGAISWNLLFLLGCDKMGEIISAEVCV